MKLWCQVNLKGVTTYRIDRLSRLLIYRRLSRTLSSAEFVGSLRYCIPYHSVLKAIEWTLCEANAERRMHAASLQVNDDQAFLRDDSYRSGTCYRAAGAEGSRQKCKPADQEPYQLPSVPSSCPRFRTNLQILRTFMRALEESCL